MKALRRNFVHVLMTLFVCLAVTSCSVDNEITTAKDTINSDSSEEKISAIIKGISSLVENDQQPDGDKIMAYLKQYWGDYKIEERDSIIYVSMEDSMTLQIDIYGTSVVGDSDWELDTLSFAHCLDSIANVLGRNISDSIPTVNTDSVFSEEGLGKAKIRLDTSKHSTRANNTSGITILVNNDVLVWSPWYETESEFEKSKIHTTMNDLVNLLNRGRPLNQHISYENFCGSTADLASMKNFNKYDIVFIDCHCTRNGEIIMPITDKTKGMKVKRAIWDINKQKWVEGVVLSEDTVKRYLPKKLDHTILFTAMCYAYSDYSLFYKITKGRGVADFMGATNIVTIKTPLERFEEFAKTFFMGGVSTTTAFKNGSYTDSFIREGEVIQCSGHYLRMPVLSNVFYSYARPLPYNQQTKALRGRMPMPQVLLLQRIAPQTKGHTRSIISNIGGSEPQTGFILKDLTHGTIELIPLNKNTVTDYKLYPCGEEMADVVYEVKIENLEPGSYAYCTYLWNGEVIKISNVSQKFTIDDPDDDQGDPHPYCVLKDGTLTFFFDNKKEERKGDVFELLNTSGHPEWTKNDYQSLITTASFDASFANYHPTSTAYWFSGFNKLKTVKNIEYLNTSKVTNMGYMFYSCSSLTSLDLSSFNTSNVTNMGDMFEGCSSLKSLDLSSFSTSKVTRMDYMFAYCSSLTSLDLSSFNTSNVTYMGAMFEGCSSLTSLDLSSFNTSNVTYMGAMFDGCSSLTSLDLSSFNTSNVTTMGSMFAYCSSLTSLDLSSFNTSNVTDMVDMFEGCSSLTNLDLSNFSTSKVTCMDYMFAYCSSLTSLDLSSFNTSNVTYMGAMFDGCSSLTSLDLSSFNTSNVTNMGYLFYSCSSLASLDLSSFNTSNVTDMRRMFEGCSSLTSLDLSSFNTSNVTNMGYLFYSCSSLASLDLNSFNTSNVTDMRCMFEGCSSLARLDLSSFNTSNVTTMGSMFDGCSSLTSLDLSSFNTSKVTYMDYMFYSCSSIKTIYAGNWNKVGNNVDLVFYRCNNLVGGVGTKIGNNYGYDEYGKYHYYCPYDASAAHIDGGKDNPGLFTAK